MSSAAIRGLILYLTVILSKLGAYIHMTQPALVDDFLQKSLSEDHTAPCLRKGKAMALVSSKDELETHLEYSEQYSWGQMQY